MIISIDPGFKKNAIVVVDNNKILHGEVVINETDDFVNLKNRLLELIDLYNPTTLLYEKYSKYYKRPNKSKKNIKKDKDFYVQYANNFGKHLLPFFRFLEKEKGIEIYYTIASSRDFENNGPGWRQKFTGLRFPNEKDVLNELKSLIRSGEVEISNQNLLNMLDIVDAIGIALTFNKHPEVFYNDW